MHRPRFLLVRGSFYAAALVAIFATFAGYVPAFSQGNTVTVPAGTQILVRMLDSVDSSKNPRGYRFTATLETNLVVDGNVIVPAGNTVYGRLATAEQAGRMAGKSELTLELTDIVVHGTAYPIFSTDYQV